MKLQAVASLLRTHNCFFIGYKMDHKCHMEITCWPIFPNSCAIVCWFWDHLTLKTNLLWTMCYDAHKMNCDWCECMKKHHSKALDFDVTFFIRITTQGVYIQWVDSYLSPFCCIFSIQKEHNENIEAMINGVGNRCSDIDESNFMGCIGLPLNVIKSNGITFLLNNPFCLGNWENKLLQHFVSCNKKYYIA